MIEVKNIRKSFNGNVILQDVTANMDAGKCNLIIGASGSGKTVFMKCLVGLFQPKIIAEDAVLLIDATCKLITEAGKKCLMCFACITQHNNRQHL